MEWNSEMADVYLLFRMWLASDFT